MDDNCIKKKLSSQNMEAIVKLVPLKTKGTHFWMYERKGYNCRRYYFTHCVEWNAEKLF